MLADGSSEVINPSSADKLAHSIESDESLSAFSAVSEPEPRSNSRGDSSSPFSLFRD